MKSIIAIISTLAFAVPAFADHSVDNASETARAAYRAADDAELLASVANRDMGWPRLAPENNVVLEHGVEPQDHRGDTLRELASDANRLHHSLSDLYRAARVINGGEPSPEDHRGDKIREEFQRAKYDFQKVSRTYYNLRSYQYNRQIDSIFSGLQRSFSRLEWTVNGSVFQ